LHELTRKSKAELCTTRVVAVALCLTLSLLIGCDSEARGAAGAKGAGGKGGRLLVIGMDGLDPDLLNTMLAAGELPNFAKVIATGDYKRLATAMPPQSPVAWANFISGSHPGKHQIYDFIHRDPSPPIEGLAVMPVQSISETRAVEPAWYSPARKWESVPWGSRFRIPLRAEETVSLRKGDTFWDHLTARGVETAVYRVPANYPPDDADGNGHFCCVSGMGTPELRGGDGSFTFYGEDVPLGGRSLGGGSFVRLFVRDDWAEAQIEGPDNFLQTPDRRDRVSKLSAKFEVARDPEDDTAKISLGDETVLLQKGEWSRWVPLTFETGIPGSMVLSAMTLPTSVSGMVRFHLSSVHPKLEVFMSPVNFDPFDPTNPISTPPELAAEIAEDVGRYYTTGIPQEHKALRYDAISPDDFLAQTQLVLNERAAQFTRALGKFESGCLFYYFGASDLLGHMFWRDRDPGHPGRKPEEAAKYGRVMEDCYIRMDGLVGEALAALSDADTLIIMSDHGFNSFRRGFNVNTWLVQAGYMKLWDEDPDRMAGYSNFENVKWEETRAYALGLNSLYINLKGREKEGIVEPAERAALLKEIGDKLLAIRDEAVEGAPAPIVKVYVTEDIYPGADPRVAPDLLIGYGANYRVSWSTALGGMPKDVIEDNLERWSGDHCIAADVVPGVIVTNRKLAVSDPALSDMGPTILQVFGIATPETMTGRPLLSGDNVTR
jgi:predicted AlkP superfamily phosphohydrolase/phosphomutase